jgi:hypothetical protein
VSNAFYVLDSDDRVISTEWTIGPWAKDAQHAGPPAALLGRALEQTVGRDDMRVARATFEILRPVPVAPLRVRAEVVRPGKSVVLAAASLGDEDGTVMQALGWLIRVTELDLTPVQSDDPPTLGAQDGEAGGTFPVPERSYLRAMEWRFVKGGFLEPGPATAWARMRYPLIDDEDVMPLTRALVLADSGNGISSALDFSKWLFINPDLTVYLHRMPIGEWVCLDASTTVEPNGIGLATSVLSDERGVIGRGLQSLFVNRRPS